MDRKSLELFLESGLSLEEIGKRTGRHPSTVSYWLTKFGLEAVNRDRHAPRGGLGRSALAGMIEQGSSIARMAASLGVSEATVKHWLKKYGLETARSTRLRAGRAAKQAGKAIVRMDCQRHGRTDFWLEGRGYYRCMRCRWQHVAARRRRVKAILIEELGGCCRICGYDRFPGALQFHHLDPATKSFTIGFQGQTRGIDRLRQEAKKCVLLCANCHAEVEGGRASLALKSTAGSPT